MPVCCPKMASILRGSRYDCRMRNQHSPSLHRYWGRVIDSPVGRRKLVASERGLAAILWENNNPRRLRLGEMIDSHTHPVLLESERQLREYFAGQRKAFSLQLDFRGT